MILRKGVNRKEVRILQEILNRLGFNISLSGPGSIGKETSFFGPATERAVKKYQKENGLKDDGIVGVKTWTKLNEQSHIESEIIPVYKEEYKEDFSDPEEELIIKDFVEESEPKCDNILELVNLINNTNITRNIKYIFFHCTATSQKASVSSIEKYWRETLKWKNPGYHIIISPDGSWTYLHDFNRVSNGVQGYNSISINISYIGGIDDKGRSIDNRTEEQKKTLETCYELFKNKIANVEFFGHYKFSNKACPSYNVEEWIEDIEKNKKLI